LFWGWGITKRKSINWQKIEAIATIVVAVFAFVAVIYSWNASNRANEIASNSLALSQQANNLTQTSLQLQNITLNFQPRIIPYYNTATLNHVYTNTTEDAFGQVMVYGSLNISIVVVTPHAAIINFTDNIFGSNNNYNVTLTGNQEWFNSSNFFENFADLIPWEPIGGTGLNFNTSSVQITNLQVFPYWPIAFVQPGVTMVDFTIPIYATLSLNCNYTQPNVGAIGTVYTQFTLFDVQLNTYATPYDCAVPLMMYVNF